MTAFDELNARLASSQRMLLRDTAISWEEWREIAVVLLTRDVPALVEAVTRPLSEEEILSFQEAKHRAAIRMKFGDEQALDAARQLILARFERATREWEKGER